VFGHRPVLQQLCLRHRPRSPSSKRKKAAATTRCRTVPDGDFAKIFGGAGCYLVAAIRRSIES